MRAGAFSRGRDVEVGKRLIAGVVAAVLVAGLLGFASPLSVLAKPANITVNTASDTSAADGLCSLREAIAASNTTSPVGGCIAGTNEPDADAIVFALGAGTPTISIGTDLPVITKPVYINGATGGATRVRLLGPNVPFPTGLAVALNLATTAAGSAIASLVIEGFPKGIHNDANDLWVRGSIIGPNLGNGIESSSLASGLTIGGTVGVTPGGACTGYCNVISGNGPGYDGLQLEGSGTVQGNLIGLDVLGATAVPNNHGLVVSGGPWTIGGSAPGTGNVVSGNAHIGILLSGCTSCVVQGNRVGTNAAGSSARPNGGDGIVVNFEPATVGGAGGAGNLVSGNTLSGIELGDGSSGSVIYGNQIGVSVTGGALGNGLHGIRFYSDDLHTDDVTIGATAAGMGNRIANNGGAGVFIGDGAGSNTSRHNTIRGNSISANGSAGIVLEGTSNDSIDAPTVTGLRPVRGAAACPGCLVDVYSDEGDEGRVYEGTAIVNDSGAWALPGLFAGPNVTATVTDATGNTSPFSAPLVPTTPFTDIDNTTFEADITWLYANGITVGCSATTFCPTASVTREQMASFLARMFDLSATGTDFFTDDETSTHEANINRLAAAGITTGCGATTFCPKALVLRDQMASFIARAAELTVGAGRDYFNDDDGNTHEPNIDRNAAAGITTGCASYQYCPSAWVTRGQMAAFLHRILAPAVPPPYPAP